MGAERAGSPLTRVIPRSRSPRCKAVTLNRAQEWYLSWTVDLLIYTVVLNLFDEYVEGVTIESFTICILTAVLLKARPVTRVRRRGA